MVITITGNIQYPITLDPSVWIFDDRKITLHLNKVNQEKEHIPFTGLQQLQKPPVTNSVQQTKRLELLSNSYYMPLEAFILRTEPKNDAKTAILSTSMGEESMPLRELINSNALFSQKGKPITTEGPIYLFRESDVDFEHPIKGIHNIHIV